MRVLLIWILLSAVAAVIARGKGRSGFLFFSLSMVFSPLVGIAAALLVSRPSNIIDVEPIDP